MSDRWTTGLHLSPNGSFVSRCSPRPLPHCFCRGRLHEPVGATLIRASGYNRRKIVVSQDRSSGGYSTVTSDYRREVGSSAPLLYHDPSIPGYPVTRFRFYDPRLLLCRIRCSTSSRGHSNSSFATMNPAFPPGSFWVLSRPHSHSQHSRP